MAIQFVCRVSRLLLAVIIGWMLISFQPLRDSALAQSAPFYQGKTIKLLVGTSAGGAMDDWALFIAPHLGRNMPGSPDIVVQNMPGAGTTIAAKARKRSH